MRSNNAVRLHSLVSRTRRTASAVRCRSGTQGQHDGQSFFFALSGRRADGRSLIRGQRQVTPSANSPGPSSVMAGLRPGHPRLHIWPSPKTWMPATSAGMTGWADGRSVIGRQRQRACSWTPDLRAGSAGACPGNARGCAVRSNNAVRLHSLVSRTRRAAAAVRCRSGTQGQHDGRSFLCVV